MTSQEPQKRQDTDIATAETEVITVPEPAPVFVDSTGRRSRLLRRVALAFGVLLVAYGGLIGLSLAGGPVRSSAVLPLPGLDTEDDEPRARPAPTAPAPVPSASPARRVVESGTRGGTGQRRPVASASAKVSPSASRSAKPTPAPVISSISPTPKPLESPSATPQPTPDPKPTTSGIATPGLPPTRPVP